MATTTITTSSANRIGAAFITTYYNALVSDNLPLIVQMYGDTSTVGFVELEDATTRYYRGRSEIKAYHEGHRNVMGPCKVSIRNIDIVPADHYIALTCSGHYLTETQSRVFTQTFVLSPTKYRDNTYYIAGETMRFLSVMTDVAEDGVRLVSEEEYRRIMNAPLEMEEASDDEPEADAIIDAAAAAIAAALPSSEVVVVQNEEQQQQQQQQQQHQRDRPSRERKPREPRERKPRERKNNTSGTEETTAHQNPQQPPRERKQRERHTDATNATAASSQPQSENNNERNNKNSRRNDRDSQRRPVAAATDEKPRNERKPRAGADTRSLATSIIFGPVDAVFKLSELASACQGFGNLQDSYWVNEDAVMEFSDAAAVTNAIRKGVTVRDTTWRPRPYRPSKK